MSDWACPEHGVVDAETVSGRGVGGRPIQQKQCPECSAVCDPVW